MATPTTIVKQITLKQETLLTQYQGGTAKRKFPAGTPVMYRRSNDPHPDFPGLPMAHHRVLYFGKGKEGYWRRDIWKPLAPVRVKIKGFPEPHLNAKGELIEIRGGKATVMLDGPDAPPFRAPLANIRILKSRAVEPEATASELEDAYAAGMAGNPCPDQGKSFGPRAEAVIEAWQKGRADYARKAERGGGALARSVDRRLANPTYADRMAELEEEEHKEDKARRAAKNHRDAIEAGEQSMRAQEVVDRYRADDGQHRATRRALAAHAAEDRANKGKPLYAAGLDEGEQKYSFYDGPTVNLPQLLDGVPPIEALRHPAVIVRLNGPEASNVLYHYRKGWKKGPRLPVAEAEPASKPRKRLRKGI